ncbi:hypothetical protein BN1088_1432036 [Sphingobacterium sp. PM2-P1-29]|nr:hypothetical protein BN1088_1432036 [Sphingobacterium sp. PM2-P1-29]
MINLNYYFQKTDPVFRNSSHLFPAMYSLIHKVFNPFKSSIIYFQKGDGSYEQWNTVLENVIFFLKDWIPLPEDGFLFRK